MKSCDITQVATEIPVGHFGNHQALLIAPKLSWSPIFVGRKGKYKFVHPQMSTISRVAMSGIISFLDNTKIGETPLRLAVPEKKWQIKNQDDLLSYHQEYGLL